MQLLNADNEIGDDGYCDCEGDGDFIADFHSDAFFENLQQLLENVTIEEDVNVDKFLCVDTIFLG